MGLGFFLDALFPSSCAGCGEPLPEGRVCCDACVRAIPLRAHLLCGRCGGRIPPGASRSACHSAHPYQLAAAANYAHPLVRELVHALKFRSVERAAEPLGAIATRHWEQAGIRLPDPLIVPVPLGRRRMRERGWNQAERIADAVGARIGAPIAADTLRRIRETPPQSTRADLAARRANVASAFAAGDIALRGRHVLLIDDVTTSGATLFEAASALRRAGARKIVALVAAKA